MVFFVISEYINGHFAIFLINSIISKLHYIYIYVYIYIFFFFYELHYCSKVWGWYDYLIVLKPLMLTKTAFIRSKYIENNNILIIHYNQEQLFSI